MAKKAARKVTAKKKPAQKRPAEKKSTKKKSARKRAVKKKAAKKRSDAAPQVPDPIANVPRQAVGQVVHDFLTLDGVLDLDVREQLENGLFAVIPVR